MVLYGISRKKIGDFEFGWLFVAYKDSLLIESALKKGLHKETIIVH